MVTIAIKMIRNFNCLLLVNSSNVTFHIVKNRPRSHHNVDTLGLFIDARSLRKMFCRFDMVAPVRNTDVLITDAAVALFDRLECK